MATKNSIKTCFVFYTEFKLIAGFPSKIYLVNQIITCIVNAILTTATVFLNSATIVAYWKSPQLNRKVPYFLIMVLSFTDLGVGMIGSSIFTLRLGRSIAGDGDCWLPFASMLVSTLASGMSIMTLSVINMERYLGIMHPMIHRSKVTRKRLLMSAVLVWFTWIIMFCTIFIDKRPFAIFGIVYTSLFLVNGVYIYTKIFLNARLSRRVIIPISDHSISTRNPSVMITKRRLLQDVKLAKSCFAVVVCFFICLVPISIATVVKINALDGIVMYNWSVTFLLMNSSLNSVVLVWRNRVLRNELLRVVKNLFHYP